MFKTTWKTEYRRHVIELENRRSLERLSVDGKEIARAPGATWESRSFQATIPDGNRSMNVDANTRFSKSPPERIQLNPIMGGLFIRLSEVEGSRPFSVPMVRNAK